MGTSPFGFGSPATTDVNVGRALAMTDGIRTQGDARYIDPKTRDYAVDSDTGRILGMTSAQQRVYLALVTVKGSAADPTLGTDVRQVQTLAVNSIARIENATRAALAQLVNERAIRVVSIDVSVSGTVASIVVRWTDLSNAQTQVTTV